MRRMVDNGSMVIVIEHNLARADWVLDESPPLRAGRQQDVRLSRACRLVP